MWQQHLQGREIGLLQGPQPFDPARPTLLMIHGSGGSAENYRPQLERLGPDINLAAIDLPGCGQTPGPAPQRVEDYAAWLGDFLAAGPIRPVLMGHSLGGAIAQQVALERPGLIRGLILMGTGSRLRVLPAILDGILENYQAIVPMIVQYAYSPQADDVTLARGTEMMSAVDPQVLWSNFTACDRFDVSDRLGQINLPTLVLVGDGDNLTPVKYGKFLADNIPGAELKVIEKAGHMANLEQPRAVNQAISDFMSSR